MKVSAKVARVAYEIQHGLFWAWFALACCAGDAVTAILLLCAKSLIWAALNGEIEEWEADEKAEEEKQE